MEPHISAYISELIARKGTLLGSQLGFAVKKQFPDFQLRPQYHGIRDFVERECADQLVVIGTSGQDVKFGPKNAPAVPAAAPGPQPRLIKTAWVVFSNPAASGHVAVNPETGVVSVVEDLAHIVAPAKAVPGLTEDENRRLCREFLDEIRDPETDAWRPIIEKKGFWAEWAKTVALAHAGRHQRRWVEFRRDAIEREFRRKLAELDVPLHMQEAAVQKLKRSRAPFFSQRLKPALGAKSAAADLSLKKIVAAAIELMSEEEIRKLNLPIGAMFDAINQRRP